jgi:hypothetical protein
MLIGFDDLNYAYGPIHSEDHFGMPRASASLDGIGDLRAYGPATRRKENKRGGPNTWDEPPRSRG